MYKGIRPEVRLLLCKGSKVSLDSGSNSLNEGSFNQDAYYSFEAYKYP